MRLNNHIFNKIGIRNKLTYTNAINTKCRQNSALFYLYPSTMSDYTISAIGHIESPYKQKFAIPRQPRLVPQAKAKLIFAPDFNLSLIHI